MQRGIADKRQNLQRQRRSGCEFILRSDQLWQEVLEKTPEMLPVLKEAGVVDSGGQGLLEVMRVHMMHSREKRLIILRSKCIGTKMQQAF